MYVLPSHRLNLVILLRLVFPGITESLAVPLLYGRLDTSGINLVAFLCTDSMFWLSVRYVGPKSHSHIQGVAVPTSYTAKEAYNCLNR